MKVLEGKLVATKGKFAIVGARFNEFIVSKLISGAEDTLVRHGVDTDDITLVWVPGAFEIPLAAQKLAQSGKYDAVICLGAVIRGSTSHYDLVCNEAAKGIAQVNLQTGLPLRTSSRPSSAQAPRPATRARMRLSQHSSWQICCRSFKGYGNALSVIPRALLLLYGFRIENRKNHPRKSRVVSVI